MHIPHPFHRQQQRGDTIVEVLIALAVISSVLAGAFFVTNHSAQNVQDTEEHARATQLLQGQIEQLRGSIATGLTWTDLDVYFCYDEDGSIVTSVSASSYGCNVSLTGESGGPDYTFVIKRGNWQSDEGTTFEANIQWEGIRGQTNSEQLLYKVLLPQN